MCWEHGTLHSLLRYRALQFALGRLWLVLLCLRTVNLRKDMASCLLLGLLYVLDVWLKCYLVWCNGYAWCPDGLEWDDVYVLQLTSSATCFTAAIVGLR